VLLFTANFFQINFVNSKKMTVEIISKKKYGKIKNKRKKIKAS